MERENGTTKLKDNLPTELLTPKKALETYDHITLTEEETKELLRQARKKKSDDLTNEQYWNRVNMPIIFPKWSWEEIHSIAYNKGKEMNISFSLDSGNEEIFLSLCKYFTNSKEFEDEGYSLKKGLLLVGPIGCGKTTLMKIFSDNQVQSFRITSCRDVSYHFTNEGFSVIEAYSAPYPNYYKMTKHFGHDYLGECFDDLGTETDKKHFGNQSNVMQEILLNRYDQCSKGMTHLTTNLTAEQIKENYGARLSSRLREMFNIIQFPTEAKDRRR